MGIAGLVMSTAVWSAGCQEPEPRSRSVQSPDALQVAVDDGGNGAETGRDGGVEAATDVVADAATTGTASDVASDSHLADVGNGETSDGAPAEVSSEPPVARPPVGPCPAGIDGPCRPLTFAGGFGFYQLQSRASGRCLDVTDLDNPGSAVQNACSSAATQLWWIQGERDGLYSLYNQRQLHALDVLAVGKGGQVKLSALSTESSQRFNFVPDGMGGFVLKSASSSLVLGPRMDSPADGAAIIQWDATGTANEQWLLTEKATTPTIFKATYASGSTLRGHVAPWDPGYNQGTCAAEEPMVGLSVDTSAFKPHAVGCRSRDNNKFSGEQTDVIILAGRDDRRAVRSVAGVADWDPNFFKLECAADHYASGLSQVSSTLSMHGLRCARGAAPLGTSCTTRTLPSPYDPAPQNDRGNAAIGDWDRFHFKAECAADEYVAGLSLDVSPAARPHRLLCCKT